MTSPAEHPPTHTFPRVRPQFAIGPTLRSIRIPRDIWYLRATAMVVSAVISLGVLAAFGRIDLGAYTMAGSMTALYTHGLPYRRRARTMAGFVALFWAGCTIALCTAAATDEVLVRIGVAVLLAAIIKVAHEASTVGPPPAVIPIFLVTALTFTEQSWPDVALHAGLVAAAGAVSWLVVMAPALVRRRGPERRAVATAVLATIPWRADPANTAARDGLATAISAAWRTMSFSGARGDERTALEAHIVAAERALADPAPGSPEQTRAAAREIERSRTTLPLPPLTDDEIREIRGIEIDRQARHGFSERHPVLAAFRPTSPSMPFFWRVVAGCLAAALLSYALGVGRPFWAITSAAVIVQPNLLLTWRKAPPRALGAVLGVGLFALLAPVAHLDPYVGVAMILVLSVFAEFFVPRNYMIGQAVVTPMALLMSQFGTILPTGELVVDRLIDTVIGVATGLAASFLIRNGHLRRHAKEATERLERASTAVLALAPDAGEAQRAALRSELIAGLSAVAAAVRTSDSEWWTHRVDEARVVAAQRGAHDALARLSG